MASTTPDSSIEKVGGSSNIAEEPTTTTTTTSSTEEPTSNNIQESITSQGAATDPSSVSDGTNTSESSTQVALEPEATLEEEKPFSKYEQALQLRDKLDSLIRRTVQTKKKCDKLDHDNKYLQEYVGNLMNSGDFLSKKV